MRSLGDVRVRGWYEVPTKPGKYPAILRVPGYGQNMRPLRRFDDMIDIALARSCREILLQMGYSVDWRKYPMSHSVSAEELGDIKAFLSVVLEK